MRRLDDKPGEVSEVVVAEGDDLASGRAFDGAVGGRRFVRRGVTALVVAAVMAAVLPFPRMPPVAVTRGDDDRRVATHAGDTDRRTHLRSAGTPATTLSPTAPTARCAAGSTGCAPRRRSIAALVLTGISSPNAPMVRR